jgi:hypothetical protein
MNNRIKIELGEVQKTLLIRIPSPVRELMRTCALEKKTGERRTWECFVESSNCKYIKNEER